MYSIENSQLKAIFNTLNRKEDLSYEDILNEIKKVNENLHNKLSTNINYVFKRRGGYQISDYTLLHFASEHGYLKAVKLLLGKGADVSVSVTGNTPLHCAADSGGYSIVLELLSRGADANAVNNFGTTPLHNSVSCGDDVTTLELLNRGANVASVDSNGNIPLILAIRGCYYSIIKLLTIHTLAQNVNAEIPDFEEQEYYSSSSSESDSSNNEKHISHCYNDFLDYWDECKSEIELMGNYGLGSIQDKSVSFYDFFTENDDIKLTPYINVDILNQLNSGEYEERLPIFINLIKNKFYKRRDLLNEATAILIPTLIKEGNCNNENKISIPPELSEKIARSLSNADILNLRSAIQFSGYVEQPNVEVLQQHIHL